MSYKIFLVVVVLTGVVGCGADTGENPSAPEADGGLAAHQIENGIGPVSSMELTDLDPALASQGEEIFNTKCAACHKFDQRYVGPSLAGLLDRRTPAFVMNMMLNPAEMVAEHPEVKKMLAEFMTPMPDQNLSDEDARAILEYIREASQEVEL